MDIAIKTAQISFPASDLALLKRLIQGMGWSISMEKEVDKKDQAENFARKICVNDEDYEEMNAHGFYLHEAPAKQTFSSEKEEIAFYDSLNEDAFMSVAETEELFGKWKNLK
jgi:hypothetical protein